MDRDHPDDLDSLASAKPLHHARLKRGKLRRSARCAPIPSPVDRLETGATIANAAGWRRSHFAAINVAPRVALPACARSLADYATATRARSLAIGVDRVGALRRGAQN
jgi:hypothetical protein